LNAHLNKKLRFGKLIL